MNIKHNVQLQQFNTLGVPSEAVCAYDIHSIENIEEDINRVFEHANKLVLLGGGSNVILAPQIDACVLRLLNNDIQVFHESNDSVLVKAGAGVVWHTLVEHCVAQGFYGLENLALIPGLVGAAPIQNIGAYGVEVKDVVVSLEALNVINGEITIFQNADCEFSYRNSIFKGSAKHRYIILSVTFRLSKNKTVNLSYPALEKALSEEGVTNPTPEDVFKSVVNVRSSKLPDPNKLPNAGSFFKNPVVNETHFSSLVQDFPDLPHWETGVPGDYKLSAAWMIDQLGWKGKWIEGVRMHAHHALVLTNPNLENASAILRASDAIVASVESRFELTLEREPEFIGEL